MWPLLRACCSLHRICYGGRVTVCDIIWSSLLKSRVHCKHYDGTTLLKCARVNWTNDSESNCIQILPLFTALLSVLTIAYWSYHGVKLEACWRLYAVYLILLWPALYTTLSLWSPSSPVFKGNTVIFCSLLPMLSVIFVVFHLWVSRDTNSGTHIMWLTACISLSPEIGYWQQECYRSMNLLLGLLCLIFKDTFTLPKGVGHIWLHNQTIRQPYNQNAF